MADLAEPVPAPGIAVDLSHRPSPQHPTDPPALGESGPLQFKRWMVGAIPVPATISVIWGGLEKPSSFHCGIDVTASMRVFQTLRAGAAPACRTKHLIRWLAPVAEAERRLFCKQSHVSATLTGRSFHSLHGVNSKHSSL